MIGLHSMAALCLISAAYAQIHGASVFIETDKDEYATGEAVTITLSVKNETGHPLTVLDLTKAKPILLKDALISFELEAPDGKIRSLEGRSEVLFPLRKLRTRS